MKHPWRCPLLCFLLTLLLSPAAIAYAWASIPVESQSTNLDADTRLMFYLEQEAGVTKDAVLMGGVGEELTGFEAALYAKLKEFVEEVAAGNRQSTELRLKISELGDYSLTPDEFSEKLKKVHACLKADCPYDLYWYDYYNNPLTRNTVVLSGKVVEVIVRFPVSSAYKVNDYQVRSDLSSLLCTVQSNARSIVNANAWKNDYRKLEAYKEAICNMVSGDSSDISKSELLNAFDGNPDTNISCEGYSKAFKYLCDLSSFRSPNFSCYLVTGKTSTGGAHMWNHVNLEGENYLTDVTWCDDPGEQKGSNNTYFMSHALEGKNTAQTNYTIQKNTGKPSDTYVLTDIDYLNLYDKSASLLSLSTTPYQLMGENVIASGSCGAKGDNVTYTLDGLGTLVISGTGDMANYTDASPAPWNEYKDSIFGVQIEDGVTTIGSKAFKGCSLVSVDIADSVKSIGYGAFYLSSLLSVVVPDGVSTIGAYAFRECECLSSVVIPETVTSIGEQAFYNDAALTSVNIPDGVASIPDWTFRGCTSLQHITMPENLVSIGRYAFTKSLSLKDITIPDGVSAIQDATFFECVSLTEITIPNSVTGIGYSAFYHCLSLADVHFIGTQEQWEQLKTSKGQFNSPLDSAKVTFQSPAVVSSIIIVSNPTKTEYEVGDTLDTSGLSVRVNYSDGHNKTLTAGFSVSGFDSTEDGVKTVTVTYLDKTATFNVTVQDSAPGVPRIAVENKSALKGSTVDLSVTIKKNPGISGAVMSVAYDNSALTLNAITKGSVFEMGTYTAYPETGVAQWYHTENITSNGEIFILRFKVKETAQDGNYNITVGLRDGVPANLSNANSDIVNAEFVPGVLEVKSGIRGDVTGDNVVAINDVVKVARSVAGNITLSPQEQELADVTGDGIVAINDVVKLARYVAGNIVSLQNADAAVLSETESAVIETASVSAKPGETVRVPVSITANPGIAGAQLDILFDEGLTLKNIIKGDVFSAGTFNPDASNGRIQWYYDQANVTDTGVLFTLEFEVKADAKNDDKYAVGVNVKDGVAANLSDYDFNPVNVEFKLGNVQIDETSDNSIINTVSRSGNTITANVVCDVSNASVFCAVYNTSGKMIAVRIAQITSELNYQFQFDDQQFDYAKAFIVDSDFRPLCESKMS